MLEVNEHRHQATEACSKYTFMASHDTNFIIHVVHSVTHVLHMF